MSDLIDRLREYASTRKGELAELITEAADALERQTCDDAVSRQAAIDALMKRDKELRNINWYDKPFAEGECKGIDYALEIVNALPSAQPEITHCAECIHWKHSAVRENYCEVFDWVNTAKDFCSFAERKQDDRH